MPSLILSTILAICTTALFGKKISKENRYRDIILSTASILMLFVAFAVVQFVFIFLGVL